jgi:hypothetical protein
MIGAAASLPGIIPMLLTRQPNAPAAATPAAWNAGAERS